MAETIFDKPLADPPFYNGLDKTVGGFALDARQGKVLSDQLTALNSNITSVKHYQESGSSTVHTVEANSYGTFNITVNEATYGYIVGWMMANTSKCLLLQIQMTSKTNVRVRVFNSSSSQDSPQFDFDYI